MVLDLNFLERICSIENSALSNIDAYKLFLDKSMDLSVTQAQKFITYYNTERYYRYGYEGILPAEYTHEYNDIARDWQRKIITIGINDDIVIAVLKRIQMFQHVYTRLEGLPISISNNRQNEETVLTGLTETELCYKINVIKPEIKILENLGFVLSEKINNYNFHCDVSSHSEKISRNKWKHKKGIKKLEGIEELSWQIVKNKNPAIKEIQKEFDSYKFDMGEYKGWHRLAKAISEYKSFAYDGVLFYLFSYKDIPIGLCVYVIVDGKWAHQIVNKSAYSDNIPEVINRKLGAYIHYITITDLNIRGITDTYFGGSFNIGELKTHKSIMSDNSINTFVFKRK